VDFSKLLNGFLNIDTSISLKVVIGFSQNWYIDLLKLLYGFFKIVQYISCPLTSKTKLKFGLDFKAYWTKVVEWFKLLNALGSLVPLAVFQIVGELYVVNRLQIQWRHKCSHILRRFFKLKASNVVNRLQSQWPMWGARTRFVGLDKLEEAETAGLFQILISYLLLGFEVGDGPTQPLHLLCLSFKRNWGIFSCGLNLEWDAEEFWQ